MLKYGILWLIFAMTVVMAGTDMATQAADSPSNIADNVVVLDIGTTLPTEQLNIIAAEYEKKAAVKLNFVNYSETELLYNAQQILPQLDLLLTNKETLIALEPQRKFQPIDSALLSAIPKRFKDKNCRWVGLWYDPLIFCINNDYLKTLEQVPDSWQALSDIKGIRIAITDFFANEDAAKLLFTMIAEYDELNTFRLFNKLHNNIVQYAKYPSVPVRMASLGEVDLAIVYQSDTIRYFNDNFPITLLYPSDGTSYILTGAAIVDTSVNSEQANDLVQWLLSDYVQLSLQANNYFFVPTNPAILAFNAYLKNGVELFDNYSTLTVIEKQQVLDRWVKNIRLK